MDAPPCAADPDLFFSDDKAETARAKDLCLTCPQLDPCLDRVTKHPEQWGVWAAMTAHERGTPYRPEARGARRANLLALVEREPGLTRAQYAARTGLAASSVDYILAAARGVIPRQRMAAE